MVKKQHAKEQTICNTCRHPVNTKGHEAMTIPVKIIKVGGKSVVERHPCPRCVKEGRREK